MLMKCLFSSMFLVFIDYPSNMIALIGNLAIINANQIEKWRVFKRGDGSRIKKLANSF